MAFNNDTFILGDNEDGSFTLTINSEIGPMVFQLSGLQAINLYRQLRTIIHKSDHPMNSMMQHIDKATVIK